MSKYFFTLLLILPLFSIAQTETDIRKHYQEVNKQITSSIQEGYEGPLYNNHWVSNKYGKSWPAVGIYTENTDYWYNDDPYHILASERNPKNVLLKVNVTRKSAAMTTTEEYLYQNGKLIFYYTLEGEEGNKMEARLYFNAKGLFKSSIKANDKELTSKELLSDTYRYFNPNPVGVLASSKNYQELFVKSM
jgi:hypothetical protein